MSFANDLRAEIGKILKTNWKSRSGNIVPEANQVELGNDAVKISGTVLYADLADSTGLVEKQSVDFAAEIYKSFLVSACRIIRENGGAITAFDGDRVMAVFIGEAPNTSAAKTALQLNWVVHRVINPLIKETYPNKVCTVSHGVGIDTSELFVARTGIRGANDLVWVGRAANLAAKMCSFRETGYSSYITEAVFSKLIDSAKNGGEPRRSMWEARSWQTRTIYRSNWEWEIP